MDITMDIIVDVDGTIADCAHRRVYLNDGKKDWKNFNRKMIDDLPIHNVINIVKMLKSQGCRIIICSAREDTYMQVTIDWLSNHGIEYDALYMRATKDNRDDGEIKIELLSRMRDDGFDPKVAFDDRNRVVKAWREAGITCLQCAEGDF